MDERLWLETHTGSGTAVLVCGGWLDEHTCERLQRALDERFEEGVERLRLDLTELAGIDYAGVNCLVAMADRCHSAGIGLEVESNRPLRDVLVDEGVIGGLSV